MVIITGTSKGIGKAIAENYLALGQKVIGIGRTKTIDHHNYQHLFIDLSKQEEVDSIQLSYPTDEEIIFIHNAGVLGEIKRFSDQATSDLQTTFQVNLFSGALLLQNVLKGFPLDQVVKTLFVSSGAGKRPIPSWAGYCASKAAVDLFLQTIQLEELEKGRTDFYCYSFAPGVVDTTMQTSIRSTKQSDFSSVEQFKDLHMNGALNTPKKVADTIVKLLCTNTQKAVICSFKEFE
jgi:benzil reductase ((S)-benzoin forming)